MALKREFVEVNNHKWAFLRFGKGKPIVLLHGFLNYADYYEQLAKLLENDFEIIIPDLPGCGFTPSYKVNTYKNITKELVGFVQSFGFKKVCFFGTSLGGAILLELALDYPEMIEINFIQSAFWRKGGIKLNPLEKFEIKLANLPEMILKIVQKPLIVNFLFKIIIKIRPDLDKLFKLYGNKILESISLLDVKSTKQLYFSLEGGNLYEKINGSAAKTVLIVGEKDPVIPIQETLDLAKRIKNDLVVFVKKEDHEIILDAPEKLAEIIKDYALKGKKAVDPAFVWKEI